MHSRGAVLRFVDSALNDMPERSDRWLETYDISGPVLFRVGKCRWSVRGSEGMEYQIYGNDDDHVAIEGRIDFGQSNSDGYEAWKHTLHDNVRNVHKRIVVRAVAKIHSGDPSIGKGRGIFVKQGQPNDEDWEVLFPLLGVDKTLFWCVILPYAKPIPGPHTQKPACINNAYPLPSWSHTTKL